jgi:phosphomevalonate kinase
MSTAATAPGKLFLAGEYAVLEGAPAVVTAVDRRAVATLADRPPPPSPVLDAVQRAVGRFLSRQPQAPADLPPVRADSDALAQGRRKLGLGSSAAVAASACGVLFEWAGLPIDEHRRQILDIARAAHTEAQRGRGSGADVAASVLGGTIAYAMDTEPIAVAPHGLELVFVWTGRSATTVELIDRVRALESADPIAYRERIDALVELAIALAAAYDRADGREIIELTNGYREAMAVLGDSAGAPIVSAEHASIAELAAQSGGAAKPSGAGGGDVAVALFVDPAAASRFRGECTNRGLRVLEVAHGAPGLARMD